MLPADAILRAAIRWVDLLQRSSLSVARELVRAESDRGGLTYTQYATALDWLERIGIVGGSTGQPELAAAAQYLDAAGVRQLLMERGLAHQPPLWLPDADLLVLTATDLPVDALRVAGALGLDEEQALAAVGRAQGKIDLELRERVGAFGEYGLAALLEREWPGSVTHASLLDDGLGYDLVLQLDGCFWHLEVKTSIRRGRTIVYLTRNEFNVAQRDPFWRLIVVRLDQSDEIESVGTVSHRDVLESAPVDQGTVSRWESARFNISPALVSDGLAFIDRTLAGSIENRLLAC